jgi:hypothetical protein
MRHTAHTDTMTHTEYAHLQVCGTCDQFCIGTANAYCELKVPEECRDEFGVIDWELPAKAIKDVHDTCPAWGSWS